MGLCPYAVLREPGKLVASFYLRTHSHSVFLARERSLELVSGRLRKLSGHCFGSIDNGIGLTKLILVPNLVRRAPPKLRYRLEIAW